MPYRFARERVGYADLAAGHVLMGRPGHPAFPVRLADEVFQRCLALYRTRGGRTPVALYDPCCGGAYLLTCVALLHWEDLRRVIGSDADPEALAVAAANLSLLTQEGLAARVGRLEALRAEHGKTSHAAAIASAGRIAARVGEASAVHPLVAEGFLADATDAAALGARLGPGACDLVIADVPYGQQSHWTHGSGGGWLRAPTWHLLAALLPVLARPAIVAIASDKGERPEHEGYRRVGQLKVGKRRVTFLAPVGFRSPP